jgi:lactate racemase
MSAETIPIEVPWGTTHVSVELPKHRVMGVLGAQTQTATDPVSVLRTAVESSSPTFRDFLRYARPPLLVIVNDATRPTPTAPVLKQLQRDLERWAALPGNELAFIIATGTHRAATEPELAGILGPEILSKHRERITSHDSKNASRLVSAGHTSRGVPIWVNRVASEARSLLLINSVEPHYFAGYTGGRKSLFPGVAGYQTVYRNHRFSLEPGADSLILTGNPVHEDLEEATRKLVQEKDVYSIQLVLDNDHNVGFAAAGDLNETFKKAVAVADRQFVLDLEEPADVVVAVAPHPMDCNFYQTNKAIRSGALALKEGGVLVVVSECPDGLGDNVTFYDVLSAATSPDQVLDEAERNEYQLGLQQATGMAAILRTSAIYVVSSLPSEQVRAIFMQPFPDVQSAVDEALRVKGPDAKVLFLTEASITVPRVRR